MSIMIVLVEALVIVVVVEIVVVEEIRRTSDTRSEFLGSHWRFSRRS